MDISQNFMFELAKAAIYDKAPQLPGDNIDWEYIWNKACEQNIVGLIADAVSKLPAEYQPKNYEDWEDAVLQSIQEMYPKYIEFDRMSELIKDSDTKIICLKGIVLKDLYPVPELRTMGDFDLFVVNEYEKVKSLFVNNGYSVKDISHTIIEKDLEVKNAEQQKVTVGFCAVKDNIVWECFKTLKEEYHTDTVAVEKKIEANCVKWKKQLYCMNETDMLSHLIIHHTKHLIYEGAGIRNVLDIALFIKNYKDNIDFKDVCCECKKQGYEKVFYLVLNVVAKYFDIVIEYGYKELSTDFFVEYMLNGGVFGRHESKGGIVSLVSRYKGKEGWLRCVFFPSVNMLKGSYTYLNKYPILLPVAWIHRLFRGVFIKKNSIADMVGGLGNSLEYSQSHKNIMKELGIK